MSDELDTLDKLDTYRWVSFIMDTTVLIGGADTEKALIFLSEIIATVYIIRGTGTANEFIVDFANAIHSRVKKYIEVKETSFIRHATSRLEKNSESVMIADLAKLMFDTMLPSSKEIKKDSVLPIFVGVYISHHSRKSYPMILALVLSVSYILADTSNQKDLNNLSEMIMDSITDKTFQKTVKHLMEFENKFSGRGELF